MSLQLANSGSTLTPGLPFSQSAMISFNAACVLGSVSVVIRRITLSADQLVDTDASSIATRTAKVFTCMKLSFYHSSFYGTCPETLNKPALNQHEAKHHGQSYKYATGHDEPPFDACSLLEIRD